MLMLTFELLRNMHNQLCNHGREADFSSHIERLLVLNVSQKWTHLH